MLHIFILQDTQGLLLEPQTVDINFGDCPDLTKRLEEYLRENRFERKLEILVEGIPVEQRLLQNPFPPIEIQILPVVP